MSVFSLSRVPQGMERISRHLHTKPLRRGVLRRYNPHSFFQDGPTGASLRFDRAMLPDPPEKDMSLHRRCALWALLSVQREKKVCNGVMAYVSQTTVPRRSVDEV